MICRSRAPGGYLVRGGPAGRSRVGGPRGVKPTNSRGQADASQQTASQLRLELPLVPPGPVLEEIKAAFFALPLAQCFAAPEPL
jgi:hypothetical protein